MRVSCQLCKQMTMHDLAQKAALPFPVRFIAFPVSQAFTVESRIIQSVSAAWVVKLPKATTRVGRLNEGGQGPSQYVSVMW